MQEGGIKAGPERRGTLEPASEYMWGVGAKKRPGVFLLSRRRVTSNLDQELGGLGSGTYPWNVPIPLGLGGLVGW